MNPLDPDELNTAIDKVHRAGMPEHRAHRFRGVRRGADAEARQRNGRGGRIRRLCRHADDAAPPGADEIRGC